MLNFNNPVGTPAPVPAAPPAPAPAPAATAPAAAPAVTPDQLQLANGGMTPESQIAMIYQQLVTAGPAEASLMLYQLERLGATHRAQVLPIIVQQLESLQDPMRARVALDILGRMRPAEAVPNIQRAIASRPELAEMGNATINLIAPPPAPAPAPAPPAFQVVPQGQAPAPQAAPQAAPQVAPQAAAPMPGAAPASPVPGAPAPSTVPGATAPAAVPGAPVGGSPDMNALFEQLKSTVGAPGAAVQASQLPTPQLLELYKRCVADPFYVRSEAFHLLTVAVAKRAPAPGVNECFQALLRAPSTNLPKEALNIAAQMLAGTGNPAYVPDALRFLLTKYSGKHGKALIDKIANNPNLRNHPAVAPIMITIVTSNDDPEVTSAASHLLATTRSKAARDALVKSSLWRQGEAKYLMRAMWDLGAHPAPYPPEATDRLKRIVSENSDKAVVEQAKALLQKSGIKV